MRVLGVIPARGGSKGLPRKNILPLGGLPLIGWTIRAAQASPQLASVVVSTDCAEISQTARELGASTPFQRPPELSTDETPAMPVVKHALLTCEELDGRQYDAVCLLQPTSPFRASSDIDGAIAKLMETGAPSVVSVCPLEHPLAWSAEITAAGQLRLPFLRQQSGAIRRQDHAATYRLNGAVYVYRREVVLNHPTGLLDETVPWLMDAPAETPAGLLGWERSIDIDWKHDLELAEAVLIRVERGKTGT